MRTFPLNRVEIDPLQIEQLIGMRSTAQALKSRLAVLERSILKTEAGLIAAVESGMDLRDLAYSLAVKVSERRYPSWKNHFIALAGTKAAEVVLDKTEPTVAKTLLIEVLWKPAIK